MSTRKRNWGMGPWQDEPDHRYWVDPATGLDCIIHRNQMGAWCGYVGVPIDSPLYDQSYDEVSERVEVHGGLTYGSLRLVEDIRGGEDLPDHGRLLMWFGFDCAHYMDYVPCLSTPYGSDGSDGLVYRDLAYVTAEVTRLAAQLKEAHHAEDA